MNMQRIMTVVVCAMACVVTAAEPTTIKVAGVTASAAESKAAGGVGDFPAEKTIDGVLTPASSWRAEVKDAKAGAWIQYDLGSAKAVGAVRIMFFSGESRSYRFDLELSEDGQKWTTVFSGQSSGKDKGFETFKAAGTARYVRIKGFGNTSQKFPHWVNIVETEIVGGQEQPKP